MSMVPTMSIKYIYNIEKNTGEKNPHIKNKKTNKHAKLYSNPLHVWTERIGSEKKKKQLMQIVDTCHQKGLTGTSLIGFFSSQVIGENRYFFGKFMLLQYIYFSAISDFW